MCRRASRRAVPGEPEGFAQGVGELHAELAAGDHERDFALRESRTRQRWIAGVQERVDEILGSEGRTEDLRHEGLALDGEAVDVETRELAREVHPGRIGVDDRGEPAAHDSSCSRAPTSMPA